MVQTSYVQQMKYNLAFGRFFEEWLQLTILNVKVILQRNRSIAAITFHKNTSSVDGSETFCECSLRCKHKCHVIAAKMEDGELDLLYLYHPDIHTCDQDGIDVIKKRFKNKVKTIFQNDHRKKYSEVLKGSHQKKVKLGGKSRCS